MLHDFQPPCSSPILSPVRQVHSDKQCTGEQWGFSKNGVPRHSHGSSWGIYNCHQIAINGQGFDTLKYWLLVIPVIPIDLHYNISPFSLVESQVLDTPSAAIADGWAWRPAASVWSLEVRLFWPFLISKTVWKICKSSERMWFWWLTRVYSRVLSSLLYLSM